MLRYQTSGWEAPGKFKELELGDAGDVGDVSLHPKSMLNKAVFN